MILNTELEQILEEIDLGAAVPREEPFRQYYFIKKARLHVQQEEKRLGRKPTCCVTTFGCQMNFVPVTA